MPKKCIIICNGPSVIRFQEFKKKNHDLNRFTIIAVNRWKPIFQRIKVRDPDYVIVGKNSFMANRHLINYLPRTQFYGIEKYQYPNYKLFKFGYFNIDGKKIWMPPLGWSGFFALQLALRQGFKEIHIFGMTCSHENDFNDKTVRNPIDTFQIEKIRLFLKNLKLEGLLDQVFFYEDAETHIYKDVINIL